MIDRQVIGDARADRVCTFFSNEQPALLKELTEFVVDDDAHRLVKNYEYGLGKVFIYYHLEEGW